MSPEQFALFYASLPESLCLIDTNGHILAANPAATRFFGTDSQTLNNKNLFELVADDKSKVENILRTWSRSRESTPGPLKIHSANNKTIPCNCYGSLIQLKTDNSPAQILLRIVQREQFTKSFTALNEKIDLLQNEIKKHQQTGTALAQRNAEFEAVFNSIPDGVIFVDTDRRIVMNNPAVHAMLGYSDEELIGNTTEMFYTNKEDFQDQGKRRYRTGEKIDKGAYEVEYTRKDGTSFWTETLGTQVKSSDGETIGFVGLFRDITERRITQKELEQHRNHLEAMVTDRTTALASANKELEAFSYSVSHDLIAPLRAIDGFSEALQDDHSAQIDSDGNDLLQRIRHNAQHMGELINDLLSLSKVTQGELKRQAVDLSEMARTAIEKLQEYEPERKVAINITQEMKDWADKRLLGIVLDNLLGNAWKYTGKENKAQIAFGATTNNGETTYFVRDNGTGFNMEFAGKLFGAFQRLHKSSEFEGTGIGLATVARILHRHNGKIWAEAEVGQGATFFFTLGAKP